MARRFGYMGDAFGRFADQSDTGTITIPGSGQFGPPPPSIDDTPPPPPVYPGPATSPPPLVPAEIFTPPPTPQVTPAPSGTTAPPLVQAKMDSTQSLIPWAVGALVVWKFFL